MIKGATGFLFDNHCVVRPPCTCPSANGIDCSNRDLSQVPVFAKHNEHYRFIVIDLRDNHLTTIPANAFQNLACINSTSIYIYLSNNTIHYVDENAFGGIEHVVTNLELQNNNLTELPSALKRLTILRYLNITDNPIIALDGTITAALGSTLEALLISFTAFSSFPVEMKYLSGINMLIINDIFFPSLNASTFDNFPTSLRSLRISHTNFESVPSQICGVSNMYLLSLNYSPMLRKHNASIFDDCSNNMTSLTQLELGFNNLSTFPSLSLFPYLDYLCIDHNDIKFIQSHITPYNSTLTILSMSYNSLSKIPSAINRLTNLRSLYLSYNQISTVEDLDLVGLQKLTSISLDGNPIRYISHSAFQNNPLLDYIRLSHTPLVAIPEAVMGLKHLSQINLSASEIVCSCSTMTYFKSFNVTYITIIGSCKSGEDLRNFLVTTLPSCPSPHAPSVR